MATLLLAPVALALSCLLVLRLQRNLNPSFPPHISHFLFAL